MSEAVCQINFEEASTIVDGARTGTFSGTAEIDPNGAITSIILDCFAEGKRTSRHVALPSSTHTWANDLAKTISEDYADSIRHVVHEWHVSMAEGPDHYA